MQVNAFSTWSERLYRTWFRYLWIRMWEWNSRPLEGVSPLITILSLGFRAAGLHVSLIVWLPLSKTTTHSQDWIETIGLEIKSEWEHLCIPREQFQFYNMISRVLPVGTAHDFMLDLVFDTLRAVITSRVCGTLTGTLRHFICLTSLVCVWNNPWIYVCIQDNSMYVCIYLYLYLYHL